MRSNASHFYKAFKFRKNNTLVISDGICIKLHSITQAENLNSGGSLTLIRLSMSFAINHLVPGNLIIGIRYLFIQFSKFVVFISLNKKAIK